MCRRRNSSILVFVVWFFLCACGLVQTQIVTVEVTRPSEKTPAATSTPPQELKAEITQGISLGTPRTWHSATRLLDGRILLVGGSNGADEFYSLVEIYDPSSRLLTSAAPLHTPRHEHSATLLRDNRVLVVGGYNNQEQWLADAEVYDPSTNSWTMMPPSYSHGVQHTATLLSDGRLLVVGGCIGGGVCTNRVEIFDPQANAWTEAAPLDSERASHAAVLLDDGRVLVAGGSPFGSAALLYEPSTDTWSDAGSMLEDRAQAPMIRLLDGRILAAGGLEPSNNPTPLSSVEIYDPANNTWKATGSLALPRYAHSLILLTDGEVLAIGGAHQYDYPDHDPWTTASFNLDIECYNPASESWHVVGSLPMPEAYAAVAFLPGDILWVTGGSAGQTIAKALSDTWLVTPIFPQP